MYISRVNAVDLKSYNYLTYIVLGSSRLAF